MKMNKLKKFLAKSPLSKSFTKFALSGASSFAIDVGLFQIFCILLRGNIFSLNYVFLATVFARILSAIYNHTVNYLFVFDGKRNYSQSVVRYATLAVVQGFCSATLTAIIFDIVQCDLELFVKIPVDVFLFFVSYIVQKKFVY